MLIQRLFILLPLVLLGTMVLAQTGDDLVAADRGKSRRQLYVVPEWWDFISSTYDGTAPLQRCFRRPVAPENNTVCGRKDKTCFFGTQECGGSTSPLPETQCTCDGTTGSQAWTCEAYPCDDDEEPQLRANGCPVDGFEVFNDPACPATPSGDDCLIDGLRCRYGNEGCCGFCIATTYATCEATFEFNPTSQQFEPQGTWIIAITDIACFRPSCETATFPDLIGTNTTCDAAEAAVLTQFPGMISICLSEADVMPTEDDFERFVIVTDADGFVTSIVFNRNAECPSDDEYRASNTCSVRGQQCTFERSTEDSAGFVTTTTDVCRCGGFRFDCISSARLVPPAPVAVTLPLP